MKQAWEVAVAYKLVWLRVVLFILAPTITSFLAITQTIDLDVKWPGMGMFARWAFWLGVSFPGIQTLIAFLDQSLGRVKGELEKKRNGDTIHLTKEADV